MNLLFFHSLNVAADFTFYMATQRLMRLPKTLGEELTGSAREPGQWGKHLKRFLNKFLGQLSIHEEESEVGPSLHTMLREFISAIKKLKVEGKISKKRSLP